MRKPTERTVTGLRVNIIGAGGIAPNHVEGWQAIGADVGVYARSGASGLAGRYRIRQPETLDEAIAYADVVDVIAPTGAHESLVLRAIAAGKPVVCEKPLALDTAAALRIKLSADRAGVDVYPAHVVRYFGEYVRMKQQVQSGRVGKPTTVKLTRTTQAPATGWFFSEKAGGGIIRDQLVHDLDQARWLAGEVADVSAVQDPPSAGDAVPSVVTAHVTLHHVDGAVSFVRGEWGPSGTKFRTSIDIVGDAGALSAAAPNDTALDVADPAAVTDSAALHDSPVEDSGYLPPATDTQSPYTTELEEFARAICGGPRPRVDLHDGVMAVALAEAAMNSAASGKIEELDASTVTGDGEGPAA